MRHYEICFIVHPDQSEQVPGMVERLVDVYLNARQGEERFIDTVGRIGIAPFKAAAYPDKVQAA